MNIPVYKQGNTLYVKAGGTLTNNLYKWFYNGVLIKTAEGDSTVTLTTPGIYNAVVTNSIVIDLTLYSDTLEVTNVLFTKRQAGEVKLLKSIRISPNPVTSILHIEGLDATANTKLFVINSHGKVISETITHTNVLDLDVSKLATGVYFLKVYGNSYRFVKD